MVRLPQGQWFDHQSKYMGYKLDTNQAEHAVEELCPSTLPPSTVQALQAHALAAHGALGIVGYSRSDFIVTPAGPVYLETNTLPGLTRASLLPLALAHAGFALRDFVQLQMALALARAAQAGVIATTPQR